MSATNHSDLVKARAILSVIGEIGGSVTLSGETATLVAKALRDVEALQSELDQARSDRDRLQRLCDKTALVAANRALNSTLAEGVLR